MNTIQPGRIRLRAALPALLLVLCLLGGLLSSCGYLSLSFGQETETEIGRAHV